MVTVFGHGWVIVATEHGEHLLAPQLAPPDGLISTVPGPVASVRAGFGELDADAPILPWSELESGTTRGGGLVLTAAPLAGREAPADVGPPRLPRVLLPEAPVDRAEPFSSVLFVGPSSDAAVRREPLPIAVRPPESESSDVPVPTHSPTADTTTVIGVYCRNGHFEDPAAHFCAVCGQALAPDSAATRSGPRPPLGVLVLDDGSVFNLDQDYVVGRDPARDPDVLAGKARPLYIEDPEGLLSRVHARIHLEGWDVSVVDLGSSNGTGVWGPQDTAWTSAPPRAPLIVQPGTQIGLGRRQMRFESRRSA